MKNKPSKNYLFIFLLLIVIFLTPLIAAILLYNNNPLWLHHKTVNKGTLIASSFNLQQIKLISHGTPLRSLNGSWFLFYLTKSSCREHCQKNLNTLRQIVPALGKNRYRVKYGVVLANNKPLPPSIRINKDPHLVIYSISKLELDNYFARLKINNDSHAYYLADPFGKIILYYPSDAPGEAMYQDLSRLLTISTTG